MGMTIRQMRRALLVALAVVAMPRGAVGGTIEGTAFFDRDGDGVFSAGDDPAAGARVAWNTTIFATCDQSGEYTMAVPDGSGIVWVSVPEGGAPGPVWLPVSGSGTVTADLAIIPLDDSVASAPLTFVIAADSHLDGVTFTNMIDDLAAALEQALALPEPARFFAVVGDVTQANRPEDFDGVDMVLSGFDVPWVPVPGNHDWYDGGAAYRARWGPDMYSFTTGGVHFVVWNSEVSTSTAVSFLMDDLAAVDPSTTVIAMGHQPPLDETAALMRAAGIDYLFTGHWHSSRSIDHDGMLELSTQPLLFSGVDLAPAGYRIVTVESGALDVDLHTFFDEPVLQIVWPRDDQCARGGDSLLVAIETGPGLQSVEILVDGAPSEPARIGGWLWRSVLGAASGSHTVEAVARNGDGSERRTSVSFEMCEDAAAAFEVGEWHQQQGNPEHTGARAETLTPPLRHAWIAPIGSHLHQAAPIVADGRVYVAFGDFVADGGGGVIALDASNGQELWRATPGRVRNSAAYADGHVVVGTADGVLHAFDAIAGTPEWFVDLGEGINATQSSLWAAPTIRDGVVYAGVQRNVAAVDLATGEVLWSADPDPGGVWLGSFGAVAVTDDLVVGTFNRTAGLIAWSRADGEERWRVNDATTKAVHAAPLIDGTRVIIGGAASDVSAYELTTGERLWHTKVSDADDWDYAIGGNLALADGIVLVGTQWGAFHGLSAASGDEIWSYDARMGPLRTANFRGAMAGYQASPAVTGNIVWIADSSGLVVALDIRSGEECWRLDLGVPVLAGLVPAGDLLLVPGWDGALHALVPTHETPLEELHRGGCCGAGSTSVPSLALPFLIVVLVLCRRRRLASVQDNARLVV